MYDDKGNPLAIDRCERVIALYAVPKLGSTHEGVTRNYYIHHEVKGSLYRKEEYSKPIEKNVYLSDVYA